MTVGLDSVKYILRGKGPALYSEKKDLPPSLFTFHLTTHHNHLKSTFSIFNSTFQSSLKSPISSSSLVVPIKNTTEKEKMKNWSRAMRTQGKSIALAPTMDYLHQDHLSLVKEAHNHAHLIVVSIYVNPGQFSPFEDLSIYPYDFNRDILKLMSITSELMLFFIPTIFMTISLVRKARIIVLVVVMVRKIPRILRVKKLCLVLRKIM